MRTYTAGTAPVELIRAALPERYPMMLAGEDREVMALVFGQGIDAHLEACTDTKLEWEKGNILGNRPKLDCGRGDMLVILRRLWEIFDSEEGQYTEGMRDAAISLRSAILDTIDIEEV